MKAAECEDGRLNNLELMAETAGENKGTKNAELERIRLRGTFLVAFSCQIEHIHRTDVHRSSGQLTLH